MARVDYRKAYDRSNNLNEFINDLNDQSYPDSFTNIQRAKDEYFKIKDDDIGKKKKRTPTYENQNFVSGVLGNVSERHDSTYPGEFVGLEASLNSLIEMVAEAKDGSISLISIIEKGIEKSLEGLLTYYQQQSDLLNLMNEGVGMSGELSSDFREEIMQSSVYANRLGISFSETANAMSDIIRNSGRFRVMTEDTMNKIALTSKVAFENIGKAAESIETFQNISLGAFDAMEAVEGAALKSFQLGLNAKKTTETMTTNLSKLNQFGFKDGIDGLNRMVQQSIEFKTNLSDVFNIADKVMDPTSAIELSANLQVIGGAMDAFNDPLRMMYMATNDVEGLQDALIGSVEQLAKFNDESGRFEIIGADLRRLKAISETLGADYEQLANTAINAAQRTSALNDMLSTGLVIDEGLQEFVTNLAQMKGGQMVVEISSRELQEKLGGQTEIALNEMTKEQAELLRDYQDEFKEMDSTDLVTQQVSLLQNLDRNISFIAATARLNLGQMADQQLEDMGLDNKTFSPMLRQWVDVGMQELNSMLQDFKNIPPQGTTKATPTSQIKTYASDYDSNAKDLKKEENKKEERKYTKAERLIIDFNIHSDAIYDKLARWLRDNPEVWLKNANDYVSQITTKE